MLERMINYLNPTDFKDYRTEVERINERSFRLFAIIGIPVRLLNIFAQMVASDNNSDTVSRVLVFYFIALWVIQHFLIKEGFRYATLLLYASLVPPLLMTILMGTVLDPGHQALTFLLFLVALPMFILDKPWRVYLYTTAWAVFFLILSFSVKEYKIFRGDLIHVLMFYFLTQVVLTIILESRMNGLKTYMDSVRSHQTDPLTGLSNRNGFIRTCSVMQKDMTDRFQHPLFMYFDLIGMRKYNDDYGSEEGDKLLQFTADQLCYLCREGITARLGEDHFAAYFSHPAEPEQISKELDQRLRDFVADHHHESIENRHLTDMLSGHLVRVGAYSPKAGENASEAVAKARIAADTLRKDVKGIAAIYDDAMNTEISRERYIVDHLDRAILNGHIEANYQPIVRTMTSEICQEEALARWNDPELGQLKPVDFVPILEEHKLTYKLDLEMLRLILRDFDRRKEAGLPIVPVSLNVSRYDFDICDMVKKITAMVDESGYSHDLIVIEITESAYVTRIDMIEREIQRFHEAGFKVWMDDFGTGYSSLNLLQEASFDLIKFDMRFMQNFGKKNMYILTDLVDLAKKLGTEALAEGVENAEQYHLLRDIGCEKMQGYYINEPAGIEWREAKAPNGEFVRSEDPQKTAFLDTLSRINLNSPFDTYRDTTVSNMVVEIPSGILIRRPDGGFDLVRANHEYQKFARKAGFGNDFSQDVVKRPIKNNFSPKFREAIEDCIHSGGWESIVGDIVGDTYISAYVHRISQDPVDGAWAILIVVLFAE